MRSMFVSIVLTLVGAQSAFAALPPWEQEKREIASILRHEQFEKLHELDPGEYSIEKNESGYTVYTPNFSMDVEIEYTPDGTIGPAKYKLHFHVPNLESE